MKCPTAEQIKKAAKTSADVNHALKELFPELFSPKIKKGDIYSWGTDFDGGSGLVVGRGLLFDFINFHTGDVYIYGIPSPATKSDLESRLADLNKINTKILGFNGTISGPFRFKSWCLKEVM